MASDIGTLKSMRRWKMRVRSCKASAPLSDEAGMPKSGGFLDFASLATILAIMLIVLNILASARHSGRLAADGIAAG